MADEVSADTDHLGEFVERGRSFVSALRGIEQDLAHRRSMVASTLGDPFIPSAVPALLELVDRAVINNEYVEAIRDTLQAWGIDSVPKVTLDGSIVDLGLQEAGFSPSSVVATGAAAVALLAAQVDGDGLDEADGVAEAGAAFRQIVSEIDEGDDLGMSNGELNQVRSELELLPAGSRQLVFDRLNDDQLEVLFHNVHSSGWWSNDWDDRERTEFYALLDSLSTEAKARGGQFSPYLEATAEAETAAAGDSRAESALRSLRTADGFTGDLDFDERTALLWQAAHYPTENSIWNLERLTEHEWFVEFDLEDTQRSAKMVAFVSQHSGDPAVINNTLDLFLAPDAPYRFDWDKDGAAFGSAGGDEFHFNRAYLDAGNDSVSGSVPSGTTYDRTEHMVTHTVAHEVNHLVNGDSVSETFEYFMGEYRAFYVGHLARYGTPPTRAEVERRVSSFFNAGKDDSYFAIASAVDDPVEGPLIAAFAEDILGRPVTAIDLAIEFSAGVTDPSDPAPTPVSVSGGPNSLDNSP